MTASKHGDPVWGADVSEQVALWLRSRTTRIANWPTESVLEAKQAAGSSVSVVIPARDEQATIGPIVAAIRDRLMSAIPLVDDLLVIDSGSVDQTAKIAATAGARVLSREQILPRLAVEPGKGEVLWRSLFAARGDLICFVDGDLRGFDPALVPALLGPLFTDPCVSLVKAASQRPLGIPGAAAAEQGGRVTELVARPLIHLHWPRLSGVIQPLTGEYAARRTLLEALPFPCGYGVEFALLVDTLRLRGLDAIAQVDVGVRRHGHQSDENLGTMAAEIMHAAARRLEWGESRLQPERAALTQFRYGAGGFEPTARQLSIIERPAALSVPEYCDARIRRDSRTARRDHASAASNR